MPSQSPLSRVAATAAGTRKGPAELDALQAVAKAANSDWARPVLYLLATPHFAYFSSPWVALPWLGGSLALEAVFLRARSKAAGGDVRWTTAAGVLAMLLPWPWVIYSALMWLNGGVAAIAGALCAQFTSAVVAALTPKADKRFLMGTLAPPVLMVFVMLAAAYAQALPWYILPVALCSALGITVVMLAAAQASFDSQRRVRQMRAELKAERDLLDRRVRERTEELAEATRQAQAANLAKSQFIANMSHELRTPLNAIIGYSEILAEDLHAEGSVREAKDAVRINVAGRSLLGLISNVLDLAKAETKQLTLHWQLTDIAAVLRQATDAALPAAIARNNRVELAVSSAVGAAMSDQARLRQVLDALLSNACKFTQDGLITVSADGAGDDIVIEVRDTGVGIADDELARLFEAFVQADASLTRRTGGAGVGLANSRNIVRLMGGDVIAQSAVGRGSVFTIRLPRKNVDADALSAA